MDEDRSAGTLTAGDGGIAVPSRERSRCKAVRMTRMDGERYATTHSFSALCVIHAAPLVRAARHVLTFFLLGEGARSSRGRPQVIRSLGSPLDGRRS